VLLLVLVAVEPQPKNKSLECPICGVRVANRIKNMETPFAIATNVEKERGNNYRIDIEIIVPETAEKFRLDLNELVDHPRQIGGFPPSGEWGNVVVTTCGLPRLKAGDKVPVVIQE
jgi:hypothetical protein